MDSGEGEATQEPDCLPSGQGIARVCPGRRTRLVVREIRESNTHTYNGIYLFGNTLCEDSRLGVSRRDVPEHGGDV